MALQNLKGDNQNQKVEKRSGNDNTFSFGKLDWVVYFVQCVSLVIVILFAGLDGLIWINGWMVWGGWMGCIVQYSWMWLLGMRCFVHERKQ